MEKQTIHNYELYWTTFDVPTPGTYVLKKKNRFTEWLIRFLINHDILTVGRREIAQCNVRKIEWSDDLKETIRRQIRYLESHEIEPTRIIIGRNELHKLMTEPPETELNIPSSHDSLFHLPITMTPFADGVLVI